MARVPVIPMYIVNAILIVVCLMGCLRSTTIANCEIHGYIYDSEATLNPEPRVMVWAFYHIRSTTTNTKENLIIRGPFYTDEKGKVIISQFYQSKVIIDGIYMGDCAGELVFIHPNKGCFTKPLCTDNYPPSLKYFDLTVTIPSGRPNEVKGYRKVISQLPKEYQAVAWQFVDPEYRQ
jgi:hypothetical protein